MKQWMTGLLAAVLMLTTATAAMAASEQEQKLDDATTVVRQFVDIPENAIPPALLGQAYGIAVIPSVLKVGFVLGGRRGKGVLSVRTADGSWSNPTFITLTGGSIGWQAGASSSDIILVFKTQRSIDKIADGQISLGADAAVAAGPVGRSAGAATNLGFDAEVYSYSRSRGLFAGVSLEGGKIGIDRDANWLFYDKAGIDALTILRSKDHSNMPQSGQRFIYTLDRYMPPSDDFDRDAATRGTSMESAATQQNGSGNAGGSSDAYGRGQSQPYDSGSGVTVQQGNYDARDNDGAAANGGAGGYEQAPSGNGGYNNNAPSNDGSYGSGGSSGY
ncbi:lipid-binding SYLF domain-containing protein [Salinisphaera sp. T31B1]|uniref:lipid-binding SYLF domain-containing protein n=1 Tax=Salinisphaera sp. T31B1 TaxID=727963 RepID=UPI00333E3A77